MLRHTFHHASVVRILFLMHQSTQNMRHAPLPSPPLRFLTRTATTQTAIFPSKAQRKTIRLPLPPRAIPSSSSFPFPHENEATSLPTAAATTTATTQPPPQPPPPHPDFDLPTAVALAGASFEAYADVIKDEEYHTVLKQHCPGGIDVIYTNHEFLARCMAGLVQIRIESIDIDGDDDVEEVNVEEIQMRIGDSLATASSNAKTDKTEEAITWPDVGPLFVRDIERDRLSVGVHIQNKKMKKKLNTFIPLSQVVRDASSSAESTTTTTSSSYPTIQTMTLFDEEELQPCGRITLSIQFSPFHKHDDGGVHATATTTSATTNQVGVPGPALMSESWKDLTNKLLQVSTAVFTPIAFVENAATDTQAWVFVNTAHNHLVLAFRGTQQGSWRDLLTDISFTPMSLDPRVVRGSPRRASLAQLSRDGDQRGMVSKVISAVQKAKKDVDKMKTSMNSSNTKEIDSNNDSDSEGLVSATLGAMKSTTDDVADMVARLKTLIDEEAFHTYSDSSNTSSNTGSGGVWVHSGFLHAYDSVRGPILGLVDAVTSKTQQQQEEIPIAWHVYVTGHSLGAALATLCAYDLSYRLDTTTPTPTPTTLSMYNYGSPRVGNKAFARDFDHRVPDAWRLVMKRDAVVTVPRLVGYCHVGHAVIVGLTSANNNDTQGGGVEENEDVDVNKGEE